MEMALFILVVIGAIVVLGVANAMVEKLGAFGFGLAAVVWIAAFVGVIHYAAKVFGGQ